MFAWRCNVCDSRRVHTRCVNTHTWYGQKGDARAYIRVRVLHLRQSWPWMRLATASDYACIVKKTIWFIFHFSFFFFFSIPRKIDKSSHDNTRNEQWKTKLEQEKTESNLIDLIVTPFRAVVTAVSWHPHGTYFASVDRAKTVTIWGDHV